MYQAPEIKHLERAVKAVRSALIPEKRKEPVPEPEPKEEAEQENDNQDYQQ